MMNLFQIGFVVRKEYETPIELHENAGVRARVMAAHCVFWSDARRNAQAQSV
jgi:hypothetical protein